MYAFKRESGWCEGEGCDGGKGKRWGDVCVCVWVGGGGEVCVQEQRCVAGIAPFTVTIMCMQSA